MDVNIGIHLHAVDFMDRFRGLFSSLNPIVVKVPVTSAACILIYTRVDMTQLL